MEDVKVVVKATKEEIINSLFEKVYAKQAEVALAEKPSYVTGGQFRYSENSPSGAVDITIVREESKLVEIGGFLKGKAAYHAEAAEELGSKIPFAWHKFTIAEWMKDLKTRINALQVTRLRAELSEMESKLNAIMPEEMRAERELAKLVAEMSKM